MRALFSRSRRRPETASPAAGRAAPPAARDVVRRYTKRSHGLAQFVSSIRNETGLSILDLGGISQSNVSFITDLGHRLHAADFLRTLDSLTVPEDPVGGPSERERMDTLLEQTLSYEAESLDGVLVWDSLQYLSRPLLKATVMRLHGVLRPGAYMLAFFHASEKAEWIPAYSYHLVKADTLELQFRRHRQPALFFNNRGIENLFEDYSSVKFFLTRDHLREVIVRR